MPDLLLDSGVFDFLHTEEAEVVADGSLPGGGAGGGEGAGAGAGVGETKGEREGHSAAPPPAASAAEDGKDAAVGAAAAPPPAPPEPTTFGLLSLAAIKGEITRCSNMAKLFTATKVGE